MLPTVPVTSTANDQNGNPVAGAVFTARLNSTEIYQGFVVPERVQAVANSSGIAVLNLWPNALGVAGSLYRITAVNPDTGRKFLDTTVSVPNSPSNLHEILVQAPYPPLDASAQALVAAQGALAPVTAQAAAALVSETNAAASAAAALASQTAASGSASAAATSATAADASEAAAAASETAAAGSATAASASAVAAAASAVTAQTGAGTASAQAVAALASADAAALSETNSAASQSAALASASAALASQTAAATSAGTATTKAAEALASAGSALTSANAAGVSETAAELAETQAAASAVTAAAQAGVATTQAGISSTQATAAAASAAAALVSETNAETAETAALASQVAAAASATTAGTAATTATAQQGIATTKAAEAAASATAANTSAGASAGSAASALAIYSNTAAMEAAKNTAIAQAALAAGHALSASSVVQQDLSGVSATALHRSPNAVSAMFIYDTGKDSDGGAWTDKCQHTSWYNEPLNGKWLGAQATEAAARAVSGATTGDYFQLTTDGKFYRLWKNLLQRSNEFDNAYWTKQGATVVANTVATIDPLGGNTAKKLVESVGGSEHRIYSSQIGSGTTAMVWTTYVKAAERAWVSLRSDTGTRVANFNVSSGVVGTTGGAGVTSSIESVGNGWYRCVMRASATNANERITINIGNADTGVSNGYSYVGDGTSGIYVWGAQVELGTVATAYEAKTTDGLTSEVFRGNKAKFPKLAGIVAEAANVTIYDLTEPGRPMWMRFTQGAGYLMGASIGGVSIAALNGVMAVANTAGYGMHRLSFPKEASEFLTTAGGGFRTNTFAARNAAGSLVGVTPVIASATVNAVAMTTLPDAPIDPVTGLAVPTIAVATAGGVSVIKHDGSVVNSNIAASIEMVALDEKRLYTNSMGSSAWEPGFADAPFMPGFVITPDQQRTALNPVGDRGKLTLGKRATVKGFAVGGVELRKHNKSLMAKSALSAITNTFNTGHLPGDIRRAYLADVGAGSVTGPELVTNGTFDTDTSGWVAEAGIISWSAGRALVTSSSSFGGARLAIATVVGKSYRVGLGYELGTATSVYVFIGTTTSIVSAGNFDSGAQTAASGTITGVFTATATTTYIKLVVAAASNTAYFDNISVKEAIPDRSYKASGASITGTLTKTEVAAAAQAVAYSGFSAANYLREPYSADLDFGTGEWSVGAWVNIPTGNAAAATVLSRAHSAGASITLGHTAGNLLTATAYDGTTTRTVTTAAAYNTGTWVKAEACYKAGRLAICVNGVEVASTNGAPLLTLNNSNAVLTIGNSYALDAPFPGSIAMLKLGATVPTPEQELWMYEQEKHMFRPGAQVTLPDANAILDLTYDDATDKWVALSSTNQSEWTGLVRTNVIPVTAGAHTKIVSTSGVKLLARSTTTPGVDITMPAYGLREELVKRGEAAARLSRTLQVFDFDAIGFTAAMTNGSPTVTASGVSGTPYVGMGITGTGIPANTTILGINGSSYVLSANCTATASNAVAQSTFTLPAGWTVTEVLSAGASKREGSTKDFVREFDGFRETIKFAVSPGSAAWVQLTARKENA